MAAWLVGCNSTPVDAIVPLPDAAITPDECATGAAIAAGQFKLRSVATGQCVAVGAPTTVSSTPARLTALVDDCTKDGSIWRVAAASFLPAGTAYEVATPERTYVFDVEMGLSLDDTPVVLYAPALGGRNNQAFEFRARTARSFEMAPMHVLAQASCVGVAADSLAISRCDASASEQEWQLLPTDCP